MNTSYQAVAWLMGTALMGCGSSGADSPVQSSSVAEPTVATAPAPATVEPEPNEEASPSAPDLACETAFECIIVRDGCGRPYARTSGTTEVPPPPDPCPPVDYALVEPTCDEGQCATKVAELPELRTCAAASDCVALPWPCGGYWAVARSHRQEAGAQAERVVANRVCVRGERTPAPDVACMADVCITRLAE